MSNKEVPPLRRAERPVNLNVGYRAGESFSEYLREHGVRLDVSVHEVAKRLAMSRPAVVRLVGTLSRLRQV